MKIDIEDFLQLSEIPLIDVRSEDEYLQGHMPGSINIPLLNNGERIIVGTKYKREGREAAIQAGFQLVGPRLADMVHDASRVGKVLRVYCWRGGMRSANFCRFVEMAEIKTHQLDGGYKRFRNRVISYFARPFQLIVLAGLTGSGKSAVLRRLKDLGEQIIDLETLASHKGSAFGGLMMPAQPTTEQFQNDLYEALSHLDINRRIWIEDESIAIGKVILPEAIWQNMNRSHLVELVVSKDNRIERLVEEYGQADPEQFIACMEKIGKKLGGQHLKEARTRYIAGDMHGCIEILLTYYDKTYGVGLSRKSERMRLRLEWDGRDIDKCAHALVSELDTVSIAVVQ